MGDKLLTAKAPKTNDIDLRLAVTRALLDAGVPRDAIRHEITLDSNSSDGRADMVIALDRCITGIEIKSGKDTLDRLDSQRERYGARFDRLCLVLDVRHEPNDGYAMAALGFGVGRVYEGDALRKCQGDFGCSAAPWEPPGWSDIRRADWGAGERMSPYAMLAMLWAEEVGVVGADLVRSGCVPPTPLDTRYRLIPYLAEHASIGQLLPRIAAALRARRLNRWEEAFWARYDAQSLAAA
ncbi:hypothetical protein ABNQ39_00300 (plasmid) [Azospirillum sp. A26]|uniref:hypothetical protein n=1 Tax=Azospirillum sp. A26 TaxID=3160607 RepID=UPI0036733ED9